MSKRTKETAGYGLPTLTTKEAARVLGVPEGDFMAWLYEHVRPSPQQWSMWENAARGLPERLIRLYLRSGLRSRHT